MAGRSSEPLAPAWEALKAQLHGRALRYALSRFISFCSARQIAPDQVDAAVFDHFRRALETESFVKGPRQVYRTTCIFWNRVSKSIPEWPDLIIAVPSASRRYAIGWHELPASFRTDVEAYLNRLGNQDPFADDYATSARPSTVGHRRRQVRLIATAIVRSGRPADSLTDLAALVTTENAKLALRFFFDRAGGRKTTANHEMARLLVAIARHWVTAPNDQVEKLAELSGRLRAEQQGMTDKNRARLRQFDDPGNVNALLTLPARVIREVRRSDQHGHRDAVRVMRALAVELLIVAPIRIRNLTSLEIERHLVRTRLGPEPAVHLVLPGEEVKNGEPYELPLPRQTVDLLDLYLHRYRPRLVIGSCPWLFPNQHGEMRKPPNFGAQIGKFIRAETGIKMNVHLFRHLSVKLHLEAHPEDLETARRLLGHRSLNTTLKAYANLSSRSAFRRYDETISSLRDHSLLPSPKMGRLAAAETRR
jgi:integrase